MAKEPSWITTLRRRVTDLPFASTDCTLQHIRIEFQCSRKAKKNLCLVIKYHERIFKWILTEVSLGVHRFIPYKLLPSRTVPLRKSIKMWRMFQSVINSKRCTDFLHHWHVLSLLSTSNIFPFPRTGFRIYDKSPNSFNASIDSDNF